MRERINSSLRQPNLANEMNKLFSLYRLYVGDRQPLAGGGQNLALKVERGEVSDDEISFKFKPFKRNNDAALINLTCFDDLPVRLTCV